MGDYNAAIIFKITIVHNYKSSLSERLNNWHVKRITREPLHLEVSFN